MQNIINNYYILFFDTTCILCNKSVEFIIKKDKKNKFKFAPLNGNFAKKILNNNTNLNNINSIVLLKKNKIYTKSTVILHVFKELKGWTKLFLIAWLLPAFLRNNIYNLIAKNRHKIFKQKNNECLLFNKLDLNKIINY